MAPFFRGGLDLAQAGNGRLLTYLLICLNLSIPNLNIRISGSI